MYNNSFVRGHFCDYSMNIKYRIQVNYVWNIYYRKKFKQKSLSQYDNALNVIVDDLHTIIDAICDFHE